MKFVLRKTIGKTTCLKFRLTFNFYMPTRAFSQLTAYKYFARHPYRYMSHHAINAVDLIQQNPTSPGETMTYNPRRMPGKIVEEIFHCSANQIEKPAQRAKFIGSLFSLTYLLRFSIFYLVVIIRGRML